MKCVIFTLLVVVVICSIAHAKYSGGSGEPNDPYQIADVNDLLALAADTNDYNQCFILTADINLGGQVFTTAVIARDTDNASWNFQGATFNGVFDGAGHNILNLNIDGLGNDYLGLFGYVNGGQIKNLGVPNVSFIRRNNSYVLGGVVGWNTGSLNNCYSTGNINGGYFLSGYGGLVGVNGSGGYISKCFSDVNVTTDGWEAVSDTGGIAGTNNGSISNSFSAGDVKSGGGSYGGLVGYNTGSINNCYSVGLVQSSGGGLVGWNNGGNIGSSYFLVTSGEDNNCGEPLTDSQMKQQDSFIGWDFNDVWTINEGVDYPKLGWMSAKYSGGTGTADDPYQIANVADLLTLAADTNDYNKCFIMIADINLDPCLPGGQVFTTAVIAPDINNTNYGTFDGNAFSGIFDGAGHKIHKLNIDTNDNNGVRNDFLGLFGDINNGTVTNLILQDFNIIGRNDSNYLGGLVGYNYYGNISNCSATGAVTKGNHVGGLVGWNTGNIIDCYVTSDIDGGDNSRNLGGLAGYNRFGNISYCYSTGRVAGKYNLGGLVGYNSRFGNISYCYSTNIISGYVSSGLGGLVGCNDDDGSISNCFSTGYVTSNGNMSWNSGGLVGDNRSSISNCFSTGDVAGVYGSYYIGGLVGINGPFSPIINCYSTGTVTGGSVLTYAGGLVGCNYDYSGGLQGSYFLVTSGPDNGYGEPLTDAQMKQQANFIGWDFVWETINGTDDIWAICEDVNYPKLAWQFVIGDSDSDKNVDFTDFALMGQYWRQADSTLYCGGTDLTGDQWVDLDDLAILCDNWLLGL